MKKTAILVFIAALTFSTAACNSTNSQSAPSDESILKPDEAFVESEKSTVKETEERENNSVTSQYEIGDIILEDGSVIKEGDLTTIDKSNVPIAVIAGFQENGMAFKWFVHYFNGYAGECPKNFTNVHALAVRAF